MTHPYSNLNDYNFYYKSVTYKQAGAVDPVVKSLPINNYEKISTMGSCFAQHLAKNIAKAGFNYFVSENAPLGLESSEALKRNYGVFSARYGNIYTVKQAVQLFDRAFGLINPDDHI